MAGYQPLKITGNRVGLVQEREEHLLPDDAYPELKNAYIFREAILRKKGSQLLGRLTREFFDESLGNSGASPWPFNIYSTLLPPITPEPDAEIVPGTVRIFVNPITLTAAITGYTNASDAEVFTAPGGLANGDEIEITGVVVVPNSGEDTINDIWTVNEVLGASFKLGVDSHNWGVWQSGGTWTAIQGTAETLIDQGDGTLETDPPSAITGTINYTNGDVVITGASVGFPVTINFSYYPNLPVMGIRTRELQDNTSDQTVFFDQKYAYKFNSGTLTFQEFIPGTTWNAAGLGINSIDFFWSTNYWISDPVNFTTTNRKLMWVTNNSGHSGANSDPPRITDGTTWLDFTSGAWHQIDATEFLFNWLCNLPYRGRMVVFNTWEGVSAASAKQYSNRIRWSTIGNPFIAYTAGPPAKGSWRDDIRGQGGFLDIPTSEDIVSIGFVRDNLVIYCERSTWQLRYTGRAIAPFQIERVNSELGAEGTFSAVQFDTSLIGIGDKGIVECDSYKSERIDIKIPDFVFYFNSQNNGVQRVHGIRDFPNRLAYWTVPIASEYDARIASNLQIFPNNRLIYNYENDSWAVFNDSLTTLGTYQEQSSRTWLNTKLPWIECKFPWINQPQSYPEIVGGNQQGFILQLDETNVNDVSLFISGVTPNITSATVITSPNHNLLTTPQINIPYVIEITDIPEGSPYASLNDNIFGIIVNDENSFQLLSFNPETKKYDIPRLDIDEGDYVGGGQISIRENFFIRSKKFNFLDEGQNIQMGYVDLLMSATGESNPGAISMQVYVNYDNINAANILPQNQINNGNIPVLPDTFFNSIIPTSPSQYAVAPLGSKFWQRIYCPTRANFLTILYTLSNEQLNGIEAQLNVQIDAQIIWLRRAGRLTNL